MVLFTVNAIPLNWLSKPGVQTGSIRRFAVCTTLARAKEIVEKNEGDIFEHSHEYMVIEPILSGVVFNTLTGSSYKQLWYRWQGDAKTGKYTPCRRPRKYARTVGWGS